VARAEPVAALYERRFVHHVKPTKRNNDGDFIEEDNLNELEDQMCSYTGAVGEKSPDRLDSLVWAVTPFLNYTFGNSAQRESRVRQWRMKPADVPDIGSKHRGGRHQYSREHAHTQYDGDSAQWEPPEVRPSRRSAVRDWEGSENNPWSV
jgi:hypothetical protein